MTDTTTTTAGPTLSDPTRHIRATRGNVRTAKSWGAEAARSALAAAPRTVTLRAPSCTLEPALVGARAHAVAMLRRDLVATLR